MAELDKQPKAEAEAAEVPKSSKKSLLKWGLIGVILLVFVGIEVGLAVFFVSKLKPEDTTVKALEDEQAKDAQAAEQQTEMGATLEAPIEVTVNIAGTNGERFLKCGVQLEYDASYELLGAELAARKAKIKNIVLDILSARPLSELMTVEGKKAIRDAIVSDVNASLPNEIQGKELGKVRRSYFDSFIIQ
jgi:flagellar protein FliL